MTTEATAAAQRIEKLKANVERGAVAAYMLIGVGAAAAMAPAISAAQALWGIQPDSHISVRLLTMLLGTVAVLFTAIQLVRIVIIERDVLLERIGSAEEDDKGLPGVHIWPARNDMYHLGYSRDTMWTARRERSWMLYRFFTTWTLSRVGLQEGDPHISVSVAAPLGGGEEALRQRLTKAYRRAESYAAARSEQEAAETAPA